MKTLWVFLFLVCAHQGAAVELGPAAQNIVDQQQDISKFFNALSGEHKQVALRTLKAACRAKHPRFLQSMWREALKSPYKRREAIKAAKALAQIGVAAYGSSMAQELESQLMAVGTQMIATGDPQFSSMGSSLQQESSAMANNDSGTAQSLAASVDSTILPSLAAYSPTDSDQQYALATQAATAQIAEAVLSTVGTVAGAVIGAYCSEGTQTVSGAMMGASLGNMAGSLIGNAIDGNSTNTSSQISPLGVQAIQQAAQMSATKGIQAVQSGQQTSAVQTGQTTSIGSAIGTAPSGNGPIAPALSEPVNTGAAAGATNL